MARKSVHNTEVTAQTCIHRRIFHCFFPFYAFASLFSPQSAAFLPPHSQRLLCHLNIQLQDQKTNPKQTTAEVMSSLSPPQTLQNAEKDPVSIWFDGLLTCSESFALLSSSKDNQFKHLLSTYQLRVYTPVYSHKRNSELKQLLPCCAQLLKCLFK